MKMGFSCCVIDCKNTSLNSSYKFYRFPTVAQRIPQRLKWIAAVGRENSGDCSWYPKPSDRICSSHFIGSVKSESELSPNYAPTIFPNKISLMNEEAKIKRHERFMQRRLNIYKREMYEENKKCKKTKNMELENEILDQLPQLYVEQQKFSDKECLVDESQFEMGPLINTTDPVTTLVCNRFVLVNVDNAAQSQTVTNDVETQTSIAKPRNIIKPSQKIFKNKSCGTESKMYTDKAVSVEPQKLGKGRGYFQGYESLQNEQQLLDLAGVSYSTFEFLLERTVTPSDNCKVDRKNRLFIFLMKLKTGLSFSSLGVLFTVHRTTISNIFISNLQHLSSTTVNLIFWPSKVQVQSTMPNCFYPDYSNTRVIIDCTEFRIECPSGVDNRIFAFSRYKKRYTAKVLIGITPGGFICLKSKVNGGRTSDSQLTVESGLIDLLEERDVVLADKGFPEIRKVVDESGKKAFVVLPPYLQSKKEFTFDETTQIYKIASVRIHVERVIQRLRIYNILKLIPASLFNNIDDILHMICVLVNLQPPIHGADKIGGLDE